MAKAILIIDDIDEQLFTENLSVKYQLIYYPDGHMKELGIHGKQRLKPMPEKQYISLKEVIGIKCSCYSDGWNDCIDKILGEEE